MIDLILISFEGCQNAEKARKLLRTYGLDFEDVIQDDLPENHPHRKYTSPSILKEGQVIYGTTSIELGCSISAWNDQEVFKALNIS